MVQPGNYLRRNAEAARAMGALRKRLFKLAALGALLRADVYLYEATRACFLEVAKQLKTTLPSDLTVYVPQGFPEDLYRIAIEGSPSSNVIIGTANVANELWATQDTHVIQNMLDRDLTKAEIQIRILDAYLVERELETGIRKTRPQPKTRKTFDFNQTIEKLQGSPELWAAFTFGAGLFLGVATALGKNGGVIPQTVVIPVPGPQQRSSVPAVRPEPPPEPPPDVQLGFGDFMKEGKDG